MRVVLLAMISLLIVVGATLSRATPVDAPAPSPTPLVVYTAFPLPSPEPTPVPSRLPLGPFLIPIEGKELPTEAELLPESARDYRAGVHEGIDLVADAGTPVLAAAAGRVVRIDHGYVEWSAEERITAFEAARALGLTSEATLDRTRGRQVWIDHGRGVVTRYVHLDSVAPIAPGSLVPAGTLIGYVGSSGYPEGGPHLHFEIRLGESYLGDGLTPAELARELRLAFR